MQLLCHRQETWEYFGRHLLRPSDPRVDKNTEALFSGFEKNLQVFFVTVGFIWGCAFGLLKASALGGKTLALHGKVG